MTDETPQGEIPAEAAQPLPAEADNQAEPATAVEPDAQPEAEKPKGVQKRIDELTRNWREAERREAALLEMLQRQSPAKPEAEQPQPQPEAPQLKTLADFNYDEAAYTQHLLSLAEKRAETVAESKWREAREREQAQAREATFKSRIEAFRKDAPDFDDVVLRNPTLPITESMVQILQTSEEGAAIAYHLGKNPEIAANIARMSEVEAAREIGRIEARLSFERQQARAKPVSTAPPPPPRIAAETASTEVRPDDPDSDKLSDAEWNRMRKKQLSRRKT